MAKAKSPRPRKPRSILKTLGRTLVGTREEKVERAVAASSRSPSRVVTQSSVIPSERPTQPVTPVTQAAQSTAKAHEIKLHEVDYRFQPRPSGLMDTDGDGIPDEWEIQHGMNPCDPSDATQDPDRDGISNLDEYRLGMKPTKPDLSPAAGVQRQPMPKPPQRKRGRRLNHNNLDIPDPGREDN